MAVAQRNASLGDDIQSHGLLQDGAFVPGPNCSPRSSWGRVCRGRDNFSQFVTQNG